MRRSVAHLKNDAAPRGVSVHSAAPSAFQGRPSAASWRGQDESLRVSMRPKKVILCIDDNEQSLSIRKFMLETRGYRVLPATSGREAVDVFQQAGTVDLVLTDLVMPEMDGAEVIRVLKELAPETPMILISGKVKMYEKGTRADAFLPKGTYPAVELLERIRQLLVKKRGPKKTTPPDFAAATPTPPQHIAAS